MRVTLQRVRLNAGGYEYGRLGSYFGAGAPLYRWDAVDSHEGGWLRASDREAAKAKVRADQPDATFYR